MCANVCYQIINKMLFVKFLIRLYNECCESLYRFSQHFCAFMYEINFTKGVIICTKQVA
jgi:hypothetical protein